MFTLDIDLKCMKRGHRINDNWITEKKKCWITRSEKVILGYFSGMIFFLVFVAFFGERKAVNRQTIQY